MYIVYIVYIITDCLIKPLERKSNKLWTDERKLKNMIVWTRNVWGNQQFGNTQLLMVMLFEEIITKRSVGVNSRLLTIIINLPSLFSILLFNCDLLSHCIINKGFLYVSNFYMSIYKISLVYMLDKANINILSEQSC